MIPGAKRAASGPGSPARLTVLPARRQILETMGETAWSLARTETFLPRDTIYIYKAREQ